MKHTILFTFLILLCLSSCKSSYRYTEIKPVVISEISGDNIPFSQDSYEQLEIKTAFIGYASDYMIYQLELYNRTADEVDISYAGIGLDYEDGSTLNARNKHQFIDFLKTEKTSVKRQKKVNTVGNILLGGLGIASIFAGGGNRVDGVIYALETTAYVAEDHRNFNIVESTIEDEIKYIKDWVLYEDAIPAQSRLSTDVIFPIADTELDFELVLRIGENEYRIPYSSIIREGRR